MIILLVLCIFTLPLSPADKDSYMHGSRYRGELGNIVCEITAIHSAIELNELIRFPCISKHMNLAASKTLDIYRLKLKNYIEEYYPAHYCKVTYSTNRLEAAIVEDTSQNHSKKDFFWYVYFESEKDIKQRNFKYPQKPTYTPFFTKDHACLHSLYKQTIKSKNSIDENLCSKVLVFRRSTKAAGKYDLRIACDTASINTYWISKTLPNLYRKLMQNVYTCTQIVNAALVINLAQTEILTKKDVYILSKFIPGSKYEKWFDTPNKYGYYLLNILACYGSPHALLDEIDAQVSKQKIKWVGLGEAQASSCIENIDVLLTKNDKYINSTRDTFLHGLSTTAQTTLDYIAQLTKDGVFVEKDWNNKKTLEKRIKGYKKAIQFLRHKRMMWRTQGYYLIRYDCLNNTLAVFQEKQKNLRKIVDITVAPTIDFESITVCYDTTKPLGTSEYTICYQSHKNDADNENSESSDVFVESSDE